MNQLNEEIRVIQTQISTLENKLYDNRSMLTGEQVKQTTDAIIELHTELNKRLEQTKEVYE